MKKKKVLLIGYAKMNLGDDMFLSMLINRYTSINFDMYVLKQYSSPFLNAKNVTLLNKGFHHKTEININDYAMFIYVGGSIFNETSKDYEYKKWLKNLVLESKKLDKPFYFLSSNFGPVFSDEYNNLCNDIIKNCDYINFRDKYSFDKFSQYPNVKYYPDLVFSLNIKKNKIISNSVGISIIDLYEIRRGELNKYYFDYMHFLANNIINYINNNKIIYLFSFCKAEGDERAISELMSFIDKKYHKKIKKVLYDGNINMFLRYYSKMEYMLCTRFHSMILSILFNQKIFVCSYSNKLLEAIKSYELNYNFLKIDNKLNSKIVELKKYKNLKINIDNLCKYSRENLNNLDELFSKKNMDVLINNDWCLGSFYRKKRSTLRNKIGFLYRKFFKKNSLKKKIDINQSELNTKVLDDCLKYDYVNKKSYDLINKRLLNNKITNEKKHLDIIENKLPLVSFVMATYKRKDYLFELIDSILNINYSNIEIIIVDDDRNSTLSSVINKKYGKLNKVFYYKNNDLNDDTRGALSRKKAFLKCKGKYILICDDDDFYINTNFLSNAVELFENNKNLNIIFYDALNFNEKNNSISKKNIGFHGECKSCDYIYGFQSPYYKPAPSFAVFRGEHLIKNASNMKMFNDSSIFLRTMLTGNIYVSNEIIGLYRIHGENISKSLNVHYIIKNLNEKYEVYKQLKQNKLIVNVDYWWYKQLFLTINYFIKGSKPSLKQIILLCVWLNKHVENYIFKIKILIKVLKLYIKN